MPTITKPISKKQLDSQSIDAFFKFKSQAYAVYQTATEQGQSFDKFTRQLKTALGLLQNAHAIKSDDGDVLNLIARTLLDLAKPKEAKPYIQQALAENPKNGGYYYSAGHIALALNDYEWAESAFRQAIAFAPKETRADVSLAYTLSQAGKPVEAFKHYRELAKTQGHDVHLRARLLDCASNLIADFYDPELEQDLLSYLQWKDMNLNKLGSLCSSLLVTKFQLTDSGSAAQFDELAQCPLFLATLQNSLIKNGLLEKLIMALRHELLGHSTTSGQLSQSNIAMCNAIAIYGLRNEYMLPKTNGEKHMVSTIKTILDQSIVQTGCTPLDISGALLLLSMYESWQGLAQFETLMAFNDDSWPDMTYTIKNIHKEILVSSQQRFETLTPISEIKNHAVKAQYEQFPYPRWQNLDFKNTTNYGVALQHEYPNFAVPKNLFKENLNILIAGCGTGRHAITVAKYFSKVNVTAIDISAKSLAYAKQKTTEFDIENINFKMADLTKLPDLKQRYDIIECSGVLHHIRHYKKALQNLLVNLKPKGLIKISLYSERARYSVNQVREIFKEDGLLNNEHKIQVIRHAIMQADNIENKTSITDSDDFYSMSGTVDLLFHEFERQFTPLELKKLCDDHQLIWLGFSNIPYKTRNDFFALHGKNANLQDLKKWEEFEIVYPNSFPQMYQFYCQYSPKPRLNR